MLRVTSVRSGTSSLGDVQVQPLWTRRERKQERKLKCRYLKATINDVDDILNLVEQEDGGNKLLIPSRKRLMEEISDERYFVSTDFHSGEIVGCVRVYPVVTASERDVLMEQYECPSGLVWADRSGTLSRFWQTLDDDPAPTSFNFGFGGPADERTAIIYASTFLMKDAYRSIGAGSRLLGFAFYHQAGFIKHASSLARSDPEHQTLTCSSCQNFGADGAGRFALLFGTNPGEEHVRGIASAWWQKLMDHVFGASEPVRFVCFTHTRPDGNPAIGNLAVGQPRSLGFGVTRPNGPDGLSRWEPNIKSSL
mmetsp:Transcript_27153/g.65924  ORF Transcript_27153/g.65924 Transcript_27153/m.65924 type:complete len:309 (+) Transcript_27153:488-1414(+)